MKYLKQNHLSLLIILWLLISGIFFSKPVVDVDDIFAAINRPRTTITNPVTFEQGIIINSNADGTSQSMIVNGTTTIAKSYDGFVAAANFTVATSSVAASWRNTTGAPVMCSAGMINADATTYAPSLYVVAGVTTDNTYSASILASTTLATTTDTLTNVPATAATFIVAKNSYINATLGDYFIGASASSTNFGNWDIEFGFPCWMMGNGS